MNDVESFLAKEFEGKLFSIIYMIYLGGDNYHFNKSYYTVLDGKAYRIQGKRLYPTGDTMLNIKVSGKKIGVYNKDKSYSSVHSYLTYAEITKVCKLKNKKKP